MHPMPELIPMLKELRLSGVLDSLEHCPRRRTSTSASRFSTS